ICCVADQFLLTWLDDPLPPTLLRCPNDHDRDVVLRWLLPPPLPTRLVNARLALRTLPSYNGRCLSAMTAISARRRLRPTESMPLTTALQISSDFKIRSSVSCKPFSKEGDFEI